MITGRIGTLIESLDLKKSTSIEITNWIALYLLRELKSNELRKHLDSYGLNVKQAFIGLKLNFLDCTSYTLSKWWRAIYEVLLEWEKCSKCSEYEKCSLELHCSALDSSFNSIANKFGITERDLKLINNIDQKQLDRVRIKFSSKRYSYSPSPLYYSKLIKELQPFCKMLVQKKLYFIYTHNNLDAEDFVQELLKKALEVILERDHIEPKETLAYTKKAVRAYANGLVKYYIRSKRSRLIRDRNNDGWKRTTVSYDEFQHRMQVIDSFNPEKLTEFDSIVSRLLSKCNDRQKKLVLALTHDPNEELYEYLKSKGEEANFNKLLKNAATYYNVSRWEIKGIRKHLNDIMSV